MNTTTQADDPRGQNNPLTGYDPLIDETLRLFAHVEPPPELAEHVQSRLAAAQTEATPRTNILGFPSSSAGTLWSGRWSGPQRIAASVAATAVLVTGAALYSSHRHVNMPQPAARMPSAATGMAPASGEHVAPKPIESPLRSRSTTSHARGRAVVAPGHKSLPHGVAVPKSPVPDPDNPPPQQ